MATATEHRPQTVGDLQKEIHRLEKELPEKAAIAQDLSGKFPGGCSTERLLQANREAGECRQLLEKNRRALEDLQKQADPVFLKSLKELDDTTREHAEKLDHIRKLEQACAELIHQVYEKFQDMKAVDQALISIKHRHDQSRHSLGRLDMNELSRNSTPVFRGTQNFLHFFDRLTHCVKNGSVASTKRIDFFSHD